MKRLEYFKKACQAMLHAQRRWVFSAFTIIQEAPNAYQGDPYAYRIVQTPAGHFFINPVTNDLELLEDADKSKPPFSFKDAIELKKGDFPNVNEDMTVSVGNLFFNLCAIIPAFSDKMPFIKGSIDAGKLEAHIATKLKDNPKDVKDRSKDWYYVDEYIRFCDSFSYLTEFTQICTVALTPKAITQAPGTIELRNKLVEENKEHLDDPVVVAKIEAELIKHDAAYLQGDPSENFLITKKSRSTARKKLFLDYGADAGLTKSFKVDMIQKSLSEGWDVSKLPTMIDALRAGSFDRGAETALGGEAVKWLYRAASNINIIDSDCGSRLGLAMTVNEHNLNKLVDMRIITQTSTKLVSSIEEAGQYLGKRLMVRSPMFCKLNKTDYCRYCVGERLGVNSDSGATAVSKLGSTFMQLSLKSFHARSLNMVSTTIGELMS